MSVEEIHSYTYLHRLEHMDDFDPKSLAGELHVNNAYCWKSDPKAVEFMAALEPWFTSIEFNYADLLASTRPMPSYLRDFLVKQLCSPKLTSLNCTVENELYVDPELLIFCTSDGFDKLVWSSALSVNLISGVFTDWKTRPMKQFTQRRKVSVSIHKDNVPELVQKLELTKYKGKAEYNDDPTFYWKRVYNETDPNYTVELHIVGQHYNDDNLSLFVFLERRNDDDFINTLMRGRDDLCDRMSASPCKKYDIDNRLAEFCGEECDLEDEANDEETHE